LIAAGQRKVASIQVLRGIAASLVVAFHCDQRFFLGNFGVDIFFIISGFIMGTVGAKEPAPTFFRNRLIRIVPLYWAVTLFMCAASLVPGVFANFTFTPWRLFASLFFIPHFDNAGHIWPLLVAGWTLNYEIFFYVIFTIGLVFGRPIVVTAVTLGLLVIGGLILRPGSAILHTWTDPLLLEFLAGLLMSRWNALRGVAAGLSLLVTGVSMLAVFWFWNLDPDPRVICWGIPAFAIVGGALALERANRFPSLPALILIGDCSYSLYLLHGLVIDAIHKVPMATGILQLPLVFAASIAVALVSWRYFERPSASMLRRRSRRSMEAVQS
jgi:exopolysaccharide production protein ExoZ